MSTTIYFAKSKPEAIIPSKHTENAGYDVYACLDPEQEILIMPGETKMIPAGIKSVCSSDYYFQLFERSSTGTKGMAQRCGVIDSGYRGEWFIPITNVNANSIISIRHPECNDDKPVLRLGMHCIYYPPEKAICQFVLLPVPKTEVVEIDEEELIKYTSERGDGMLGSSGK